MNSKYQLNKKNNNKVHHKLKLQLMFHNKFPKFIQRKLQFLMENQYLNKYYHSKQTTPLKIKKRTKNLYIQICKKMIILNELFIWYF